MQPLAITTPVPPPTKGVKASNTEERGGSNPY